MHDSKPVCEMFIRLLIFINGLKALDRNISNVKLISKILQSLSKKWEPNVNTIL